MDRRKILQNLKKKRFLFPIVLVGQFVLVIAISGIFNLEQGSAENAVLGLIYTYVWLGTFIWLFTAIIREHREKYKKPDASFGLITAMWSLKAARVILIVIIIWFTLELIFSW